MKNYVTRMFRKLGLQQRTQAAAYVKDGASSPPHAATPRLSQIVTIQATSSS